MLAYTAGVVGSQKRLAERFLPAGGKYGGAIRSVTCGHTQKDVLGRRRQCIPTTIRSIIREAGREGEIPRVPLAAIDLEGRWRLKAQA